MGHQFIGADTIIGNCQGNLGTLFLGTTRHSFGQVSWAPMSHYFTWGQGIARAPTTHFSGTVKALLYLGTRQVNTLLGH